MQICAGAVHDRPRNCGVHCQWRAARSPWSLACQNECARLLTLRGAIGRKPSSVHPDGLVRLPGHVATALRDGVDQPFVTKNCNRTPRRSASYLERVHKFALGRDARVRPVLARLDATPEDVRDLPVRRKRCNRVNAVSGPIRHIDNASCTRLMSYESIRMYTSRYKRK